MRGSLRVAQAVEQPQVLGAEPDGGDLATGVAEVEPAQQPVLEVSLWRS